ncbi:growth-blocking peptide, long form-like [Anticarsia gemmatalis]|uniref:growth-blocking peptide, long form-like n=1 Tax=Anticarsia gemmatalis TaxID=129554 RepID=UPI003F76FA52
MKLSTCFIFCAIFVLQCNSADGNLRDFFGGIHDSLRDTVQKTRTDIRNLLSPKDKNANTNGQAAGTSNNEPAVAPSNNQQTNTGSNGGPAGAPSNNQQTNAGSNGGAAGAPSNNQQPDAATNNGAAAPPSNSPQNSAAPNNANQGASPVEVTTLPTSTTTKKDGKENFSGACLPGYVRTADGRCKPTF